MKDLLKSIPKNARPYALLVLALIPILAVWATYDDVVRRQQSEIERLRQGRPAPAAEDAPAAEPTIAPAPAAGGGSGSGSGDPTPFAAPTTSWSAVVSPDGAFQVSLPPGTKLIKNEGVVYVMADPTPKNALPIMVIKQPSEVDKQGYRVGNPYSVILKIGTQDWWLYTWQYKAWPSFDRVVASFKVL